MNDNKKLTQLHSILLQMIKEIDELCRKNNITYYLNGGNALGAVRHNGFIPWDDDMDIMMHTEDYQKFLKVCKTQLDPQKWYIQEAWKDWPGCFSKIRLKGTYIDDEGEWKEIRIENRGIFIDVFEIVNSPESRIQRYIQYSCAKLLTAYSLLIKGYKTRSMIKRAIISFSNILRYKKIYNLIRAGVYRHNCKETKLVANFFGMSRFHSAFYPKDVFRQPVYHQYEDIELPLPTKYEYYLRKSFGNYMELPPVDKRKPAHALEINFGKYIK